MKAYFKRTTQTLIRVKIYPAMNFQRKKITILINFKIFKRVICYLNVKYFLR